MFSQGLSTVRTFNMTWLMDQTFGPWLRYDKVQNRMFCRYCEKFERSERNQVRAQLFTRARA
jgi:hypothetical protein